MIEMMMGGSSLREDRYLAIGRSYVQAQGDPLYILSAEDYSEVARFRYNQNGVNNVIFSPNGDFLLATLTNNTTRIISTDDWVDNFFLNNGYIVLAQDISPDGNYLSIGLSGISSSSATRLVDIASRETVSFPFPISTRCTSVSFSPAGKYLAISYYTGSTSTGSHVEVWDIDSQQIVFTEYLGSASANAGSVKFSPDGSHLIFSRHSQIALFKVVETNNWTVVFDSTTSPVPIKGVGSIEYMGGGEKVILSSATSLGGTDDLLQYVVMDTETWDYSASVLMTQNVNFVKYSASLERALFSLSVISSLPISHPPFLIFEAKNKLGIVPDVLPPDTGRLPYRQITSAAWG